MGFSGYYWDYGVINGIIGLLMGLWGYYWDYGVVIGIMGL